MPSATSTSRRFGQPLASIIVNNYNYGRFLGEAVDSALAQTYAPVEVLVVDDGSIDHSRSVIESYGSRIVAVLKKNGGQASAFNAGFTASRGEVVIFLDADDVLMPTAVERALESFTADMAKVHWPMQEIDSSGEATGRLIPHDPLPKGDLRAFTFRKGPSSSVSPPTSGNAWARTFLDQVMPVPEKEHRIGADAFLFGLAPAFGTIGRLRQPHGRYRVHGRNNYRGRGLEDRLRTGLCGIEEQWRLLKAHMSAVGRHANTAEWELGSYFHRLRDALDQIDARADAGETLIVADEGKWGLDPIVRGRRFLPFLEHEGDYWGPPEDDETAIGELERMKEDLDVTKFIVAWPAFWWLAHYETFAEHLRAHFACAFQNENMIIFDLA